LGACDYCGEAVYAGDAVYAADERWLGAKLLHGRCVKLSAIAAGASHA
jgi:hypothetical protein